MANLATSGVTVVEAHNDRGPTGKKYVCLHLTLVLTAMGTATNKIQASTLGLTSIVDSLAAVKSDNTVIVPTSPSTDGTLLLLGGGAANAPADYTGTFNVTVWGVR